MKWRTENYVEQELTKTHEAKLENFRLIEEKLKKEEIDLISKRNIMDRAEFEEKVRNLNEKAQNYQEKRRKWFDQISDKRNKAEFATSSKVIFLFNGDLSEAAFFIVL